MEVTSSESQAIPQMADAREVVAAVKAERVEGLQLTALVPNAFGARAALEMELDAVNFVLSVSETHNRENVRRTVDESFAELAKIAEEYAAAEKAPRILLSLATTFGCPFEGPQPVSRVADMVHRATDLGVTRIIFADTSAWRTPSRWRPSGRTSSRFFRKVWS
jgi:hydroxymethylglutaryl-CoA lyase